ncbi:MAG: Nif3-like dinuclear metal center hexameric protein [Pedobacter sp.]|nr:MAG: Nif3-like dinuclear metal center hexameric protein [Pedobacter sp.]
MIISDITKFLEALAPLNYQESYDNSGLIVGRADKEVTGVLLSLDCTEAVVQEALDKGCNLVISHHPIVFKGLKKFNGKNYVERVIMRAIKEDIAIYAIHTNLDAVLPGVNGEIARRLGLVNPQILAPKSDLLLKLVVYGPTDSLEEVSDALFEAGAGHIGNYKECSFRAFGEGTFNGEEGAQPFVGEVGNRHLEAEFRLEVIISVQDQAKVLKALKIVHPYEEVAYDLIPLANKNQLVGSGLLAELSEPVEPLAFLHLLKDKMQAQVIRHTNLLPKKIKKVAICGGSGSFLLPAAIGAGADAFVTADFKYHEFFDAEGKLTICDIGHFETEQFTPILLHRILENKFSDETFLVTEVNTNPISYF